MFRKPWREGVYECPGCRVLGAWDDDVIQIHHPRCPNARTDGPEEWEVKEAESDEA